VLVNYEHHAVASPYRVRFAIYVRKGEKTYHGVDEVPEQLRIRTLAVRAFDAAAMMVGPELVDGPSWRAPSNGCLKIAPRLTCTFTTPRPDAMRPGWNVGSSRFRGRGGLYSIDRDQMSVDDLGDVKCRWDGQFGARVVRVLPAY
jgi:hypothetical protein